VRGKRTDGNHAAIRDELRKVPGAFVLDVHAFPDIGCDLLVYFGGECIHVEVKDGTKPPSARRLTDNELAAQQRCVATGVRYHVVMTVAECWRVMGIEGANP
jgi:hypothetical protein